MIQDAYQKNCKHTSQMPSDNNKTIEEYKCADNVQRILFEFSEVARLI